MKKEMLDALNAQMNYEFYSAHIYLSMASYAAELGLQGFENWLLVQYEEEVFHARKFFSFIVSRGERPIIKGFENPEVDFKNMLNLLETALHHEQIVTSRIHDLMKLADSINDYAARSFLLWFIDEQVEEEESFNDLIVKVKLVKDAGLYLLDKELSTRTFTPEAE